MRSDRLKRMTLAAVVALATLAPQLAHAAPPVPSPGQGSATWSIGQVEIPLSATGGNGAPYTWSVIAGLLPPGISLRTDKPSSFPSNASAGLIGVATTLGTYDFTLRVTSGGEFVDQTCTLKITMLRVKDLQQLPDAFVGKFYTYTLTALGADGTGSWTATDPANFPVPAGMSLTAAGVLSGTPLTAGDDRIAISLTDGTDTLFQGLSLRVSAIEITTPGVLPNATQNVGYTASVAASPTGAYTFFANGLPNGLSMDEFGGISGTVNSNNSSLGKFPVNVTASSGSASYTKTMSIDVVGAAPTLPSIVPSSSYIYDCTIGVPCSRNISVQNGGTAPFTWAVGRLPEGITMRFGDGDTSSWIIPGDAELWGTAETTGTTNVLLIVTDANGATATNIFPMIVSPLLQTTFLPNGTIDTLYSQTLRVIGGTGPYTAVQSAGQLATGLAVGGLALSGVPTESGNFNPAFTYTDSDAPNNTLRVDNYLLVNGAGSNVSINTGSDLGSWTTGSSYSNQFSACCAGSITWSLIGGSLPPGLTLSTDGLLNGTPSSGTYTFLLKATNAASTGNYAARQFTLNVTPLSIQTNSILPFGNVNSSYSQTLTATGGTGVTWTVVAGNYLPPGLDLASDGLLSGLASQIGQYQFTVTAAAGGNIRTAFFTLSIYPAGGSPPLTISNNSDLGTWSIGQIETALTATGGSGTGTYAWSLSPGSLPLPPGISIRTDLPSCCFPNTASAGLIGIATTPGNYFFTLRVTSGGHTFDQGTTLTVTALTSKESQLPDAFLGVAYQYQLSALGYSGGGASWTASGSLPAGLSLSSTGAISGIPLSAGSNSTISFNLTDGVDTVFKSVSVSIYAVQITTPAVLPNVTQGGTYNTTIAASGGTGSYTFSANGLPSGLSINNSSGLISGTVSSSGSSNVGKVSVSVTASSGGQSYTKTMSIDVLGTSAALPSIAPSGSFVYDCTIGVWCTRTIAVQNGGSAPFTWTASGLPPGMSIRFASGTTTNSVTPGDAQLWGTPTATGTSNVQFTVTDSLNTTATNTFPMSVSPLLQTNFLPNGTRGTAYSQALRVIGGTSVYTATLVQTGVQLPAGLTFSGVTLGGTPAENGSFNLPLQYNDAIGRTLRVASSLFISGGTSTISINNNGDLGSISVGSSFSNTLSNLNACCASPYTWSVTGGTQPPGLTLSSSSGQWGGTATTAGFYTFLVEARNGTNFGLRQFTLNVTPISINGSSPLTFGNVDTPYTATTFTATGGTGTLTWTLAPFSYLPPGVTLNAASGALSGTPSAPGQFFFTVSVTRGSFTAARQFSVSIYPPGGGPPLSQTASSSIFGTRAIGQIEMALSATGGNGTYAWSVVNGSLPPGLSVRTDPPSCCFQNASAGLIGIATTPGSYPFTLRVTSFGETVDQPGTLIVTALTTKENQLPDAFVGAPFSYTLTALNGAGVTSGSWTATNGIPTGMSLNSGGTLSGSPANAGFYNINFTLTAGGVTVTRNVSLNVYQVQITTTGVLPNATQGGAYSATIAASGGTGGYTFTANNLPNGLSLSAGVITGTVNASAGTYGVNITAQAGNGSYTKSMSIFVVGSPLTPPAIAPYGSSLDDCTIGVACRLGVSVFSGGTAPFTWTATGLPLGMSIGTSTGATSNSPTTPGDGELWGTPMTGGNFAVAVTMTDAADSIAHGTFQLHVSELLQTNYLPNGTLGTGYTQTLRVIGGTGPYTGTQAGGQMPSGVALAGGALVTGALVSGTPLESGSFSSIVSYTDSTSHTFRRSNFLNINGAGSGNVGINSNGDLGSAPAFIGYSTTLNACCATGSIAWTKTSGTLPPGVTLSSVGVLSGTPTTAGLYTFLVKAADSSNSANFGARQFTLTVAVATITLSASSAVPGQTVTATVTNGPGNAADWVGLYPAGAPSATANRVAFKFLNGLTTAPTSGLSGAILTFTLPTAPGSYDVRFFLNNSLTLLATSGAITIAPPSIALNAATAVAGQTVTATVANGPGNAADWVGLYPAGAPSATANRLAFQFLNGLTTAPASGVNGATLTFTLPTFPGTYDVRFFLNGSLTVLAMSGSITVAGISLNAATAVPGQIVTATVTNGPGNAADWVGLYPAGASSATANRLAMKFLNGLTTAPASGVSGATLTFTLPTAPGSYEVRLFLNGSLTLLATSGVITIAPPSIALNAATAAPGQTVTATVTNGPGNAADWVGLYPAGAPSATVNRLAMKFLNGLTTAPASGVSGATITFTLPAAPGSYDVRLFLNNSLTLLATSGAITIASPSIALNATTAVAGQTVTATVTNGPGNAADWVGLYPAGAPSATVNRLAMKFLNGLTTAPASGLSGATLTFTLPSAPGSYDVRLFLNGSLTVLATSGSLTVAGIALNATTAVPGQTVTATVTNGPGNAADWVGLYPAGAPSATANRLAMKYLNGLTTAPASGVSGATLTFTLPTAPGSYDVRFFLNNSLTLLATSGAITIAPPSIALNAATAVAGQTVTAIVTNGPGNAADWVGLYPAGAPSATVNRLAMKFLNGLTTAPASGVNGATLTFTLPILPGTYDVRFFLNGSLTVLATSGSITVAGIALNAATAVPGQIVTATVTNGPGNAADWVGLYPAGAPSATVNRLAMKFLNGLTTAPANGVSGATLTFTLPTAPGSYDVRFFLNNSLTLLATSGAVTTAPPSIAVNAATAVPGQTVTATVTNGPGNAADWVGLYPAGAPSATVNRLAFQFLNGLTTAPASGVSGATLTFTLPTAPGSYDVRFFLNNSLTLLATSAVITIAPPSIVLNAATAVAGQTVTATVTNGPGNAADWVGLYPAGASSATVNRLAMKFLNGLTTAPASGVSGATLTFTMPTTPGSYDMRFFLNGSLTLLATSGAITVTP